MRFTPFFLCVHHTKTTQLIFPVKEKYFPSQKKNPYQKKDYYNCLLLPILQNGQYVYLFIAYIVKTYLPKSTKATLKLILYYLPFEYYIIDLGIIEDCITWALIPITCYTTSPSILTYGKTIASISLFHLNFCCTKTVCLIPIVYRVSHYFPLVYRVSQSRWQDYTYSLYIPKTKREQHDFLYQKKKHTILAFYP